MAAAVALAGLGWFFFGPRQAAAAGEFGFACGMNMISGTPAGREDSGRRRRRVRVVCGG
ncbi:MAG TPA: hypothetical protein VMK84_21495 [Streptosporangiaceae bacterium]|nr:hypothetical protein [Streptosporangiaceae bacterium]